MNGSITEVQGLYGSAKLLPAIKPRTPAGKAALAGWFLEIPQAHPFWTKYLLGVCHLRDIPGAPPAKKQYPEAEYELMVLALNPESKPSPDDLSTLKPLLPPNVVVQFHGVTDEQAKEIARLAARACVDGVLWVEPSDLTGMREKWSRTIRETAEHYTKPTLSREG